LPLYLVYLFVSSFSLIFSDRSIPFVLDAIHDYKSNFLYLMSGIFNLQNVINFSLSRQYNSSYYYGHLWTLSVEIQFYLLSPLLFFKLKPLTIKNGIVVLIILIPLLRLAFVQLGSLLITDRFFLGSVLYENTVFQIDAFCCGIWLAMTNLNTIPNTRKLLAILCTLLVVTLILHSILSDRLKTIDNVNALGFDAPIYHVLRDTDNIILNNRYLYTIPLLNFMFTFIILQTLKGGFIYRIFKNRILVRIGRISYSIYIIHLCLTVWFQYIDQLLSERFQASTKLLTSISLSVGYIFVLYGAALVSYKYIERKFHVSLIR
jgi:peptidoglycan/LPS O-acetylase OafA/YrhL